MRTDLSELLGAPADLVERDALHPAVRDAADRDGATAWKTSDKPPKMRWLSPPPELLARHPNIDWRGRAGLRDVVSHPYFALELPLLRPTVVDELPALLAPVAAELARS